MHINVITKYFNWILINAEARAAKLQWLNCMFEYLEEINKAEPR